MHTAGENHPRRPASSHIAQPSPDVYDSDDVYGEGARSPLLQSVVPRLTPSLSPEPMLPIPEIAAEKGPHKEKHPPSMAEGVLIHFMGNGEHQEVSRQVAREPLASDDGDQSVGGMGVTIIREKERDRQDLVEGKGSPAEEDGIVSVEADEGRKTAHEEKDGEDLAALAAKALRRTERSPPRENVHVHGKPSQEPAGDPMEDVKHSIPSIVVNNTPSRLIPDLSIISEMQISTTGAGALPPIQHLSNPTLPNGSNSVTLPSLSDHLGDIKNLPDTPRDISNFPQSPPPPPPPRFSGHGSPPRSPIDFRALPSPGRNFFYGAHRRPSQVDGAPYSDGLPYPSPVDYNSSNAETPSDQSTPAVGIDRMRIDDITNPQIGGYQCTYAGCTAQPFQTQVCLSKTVRKLTRREC